MPDSHAPDSTPPDPIDPQDGYASEDDAMPVESPRRAASARFVVDSEVVSHVAIREAMDPANQSLADALRLSFKVLQVVILVLVVMFLFSGWQEVKEGETGVLSVWGDIVDIDADPELPTGVHFSAWPYPAGEFHIIKQSQRLISMDETFWPWSRQNTVEESIQAASVNDRLRPGRDGTVLTADGDIGHLQLSAQYSIQSPADFLMTMSDEDADRVVSLALQRAVVHVGAGEDLDTLVNAPDAVAESIRTDAQKSLSGAGILLSTVTLPKTSPPLAVRKTQDALQDAQVGMVEAMERAREQATQVLTSAAGSDYKSMIELIDAYEAAMDSGDELLAATSLRDVNAALESPDAGGQVAAIIGRAQAYQSQIETTLGSDQRLHASLLERYRRSPRAVVHELWAETYAKVLARADSEPYFVPAGLKDLRLRLTSLDAVAQLRIEESMKRREMENTMSFMPEGGFGVKFRGVEGFKHGQDAGRQLRRDDEGNLTSQGRSR
ncbi:MAG: SPFH domain-containing protein [Planctomycetota bacterium]|jgi:membrane protease subunit HflK